MSRLQIGENAGKVWRFLDAREGRSAKVSELTKALSLTKEEVLLALGWLNREDKVYFKDSASAAAEVALTYQESYL